MNKNQMYFIQITRNTKAANELQKDLHAIAKDVADCTTGNIEGLIQHLEKQHEYAIIANKRCKQEKIYVSSVEKPSDKIFIQLCESLIITCTPVRSEINFQI